MTSDELFAQTPPTRLFLKAAVPGAIGMLAGALYQTFDGIFVGQYLGTTAFAAVNLAMPFVVINFAVSDLIGVGSSVVISLLLGRGERAEANNAFTCSVLLILGLGVALGAALFAGAPLIMSLMGATGELAELAVSYLRVYALWSPLTTLFYAMDNYMRISGYLKANIALCVLMSVFALALEVLFLGVLGWGIWAAGLACSLAILFCLIPELVPFVTRRATLSFCRPRFTLGLVRKIFACGSPPSSTTWRSAWPRSSSTPPSCASAERRRSRPTACSCSWTASCSRSSTAPATPCSPP